MNAHWLRFLIIPLGFLFGVEALGNPVDRFSLKPVKSPARNSTATEANRLLGETVYVRIGTTAGDVEGVYEFSDSVRELLVPVFAATKTPAAEALNDAQLRVMIDDIELTQLAPAEAPFEMKGLPRGVKLVWFSTSAAPGDTERLEKTPARTVRLSYRQPLLHDRFLYLPVIAPGAARTGDARNWRYQMFVRSIDRLFSAPELPADSRHLGDVLVVYLRDRELVDLPVPPRKRPAKTP